MYRGKQIEFLENLQASKVTQCKQPETQDQVLQRQVNAYTRKLEEEKRRLFRAQENHKQVLEGYHARIASLEKMKTKKYKNQMSTLNSRVTLLSKGLQKNIMIYNQALSRNNHLKNEIDELRKDRKNLVMSHTSLCHKMEEMNSSMHDMEKGIEEKRERIQKYKNDIMSLRKVNEEEHYFCLSNISNITDRANNPPYLRETLNGSTNKLKAESSDTQPIYKLRLRNLIHRNKQKIRVIELYRKNMEKIEKNFQEIQDESAISDIQEIVSIFLKQEDQSTFILEFIEKLTNNLELLKDNNTTLNHQIKNQQQVNDGLCTFLSCTPEQRQASKLISKFIHEKNKPIQQTNDFLAAIKDKLFHLLQVSPSEPLTTLNIEEYLAKLEELINEKCMTLLTSETNEARDSCAQSTTKYSRPPPSFAVQDLKDRNDDGIMEQSRLREYAHDFLDKKKVKKIGESMKVI